MDLAELLAAKMPGKKPEKKVTAPAAAEPKVGTGTSCQKMDFLFYNDNLLCCVNGRWTRKKPLKPRKVGLRRLKRRKHLLPKAFYDDFCYKG